MAVIVNGIVLKVMMMTTLIWEKVASGDAADDDARHDSGDHD